MLGRNNLLSRQLAITLHIGRSFVVIGLGGADRCLRGCCLRPRCLELGLGLAGPSAAAHCRLSLVQVSLGLLQLDLEVTVIQDHQRITGLHVLVVVHQNAGDKGGNPRSDQRDVAVYLGIVGGDMVPGDTGSG